MSSMSCGLECGFLGMKMRFKDRKVGIDMKYYLEKAVQEFGEEGLTPSNTLAKFDLRFIDEDSPNVSKNQRAKFHSFVVLIMCVSCRGRIDLQQTVFFCPREKMCTQRKIL